MFDPNGWGHFDFLEHYYLSKPHKAYFFDALNALALVTISHRAKNLSWMQIRGLECRNKALHALREVLDDKNEASSDDVLLSFYMLERCEVCLKNANAAYL